MMEASAENSTYEPLDVGGGGRNSRQYDQEESSSNTTPPQDTRHIVYMALLTAGIGFVLPYNAFISASDYWQERFQGRSVTLDMSLTYILVSFLTVILNNVFLSIASFRVRIIFGYIISFTTLIFVALCEVAFHLFSTQTAYSVNLAAISFVAIGCTVQQSSFYGFTSMLPKRYSQSVMAGESIAGFLVSSNRVVTKLLIRSDQTSTVIFFLTSTIYVAFSYLLHSITIDSPFVRYHMKSCTKIVLRPDENEHLDEPSLYGHLTIESPPISAQIPPTLSFSNPVYELSMNPNADLLPTTVVTSSKANNQSTVTTTISSQPNHSSHPAFKVEHVMNPSHNSRMGSFKEGLETRWHVAQTIYPYMAGIALAYCVTLSIYPGLESEIVSCNLGSWTPVLLMFTFNTADVIGKILAAVPYNWSRRQLILMSSLRALLIPLLLLCVAPRHQPTISGEIPPFLFTAALGISNGLAGSLPIMLAPSKVPATLKEVTGNMMTLSYMTGLVAGSMVGYVFEGMLGPQSKPSCLAYPYIAGAMNTTTQQTITSTASTIPVSTTLTNYFMTSILSTVMPFTQATSPASTGLSSEMSTEYSDFSTIPIAHQFIATAYNATTQIIQNLTSAEFTTD